jgi:hypothetical protein
MMMKSLKIAVAAVWLLLTAPAAAQAPAWDAQPWLEDLATFRAALETKYANLDWLQTEREVDVGDMFDRAERLVRSAGSDAGAIAIFNRVITRIGDGHVSLNWPRPAGPAPQPNASAAPPRPATAETLCSSIGYGSAASSGITPSVTGYTPLPNSEVLPAGTATVGGVRAGFLRIGIFDPHGSPPLCHQAVAALAIPLDRPCDDECQNRIITHAYRALGEAMIERLTRLKAAGAELLVVDLTGNGGGSEWVEAAARMLTPRPLRSARAGFVRGPHWAGIWTRAVADLRAAAGKARGEERRQLLAWVAEAEAVKAEAERTCAAATDCPRVIQGRYATGLLPNLRSGELRDKPWSYWIFNAAQHHFREGAWDGPVAVLTDGETWSAAEQFAALLQDNRAALIVGARTGGSGCGHSWGGTPTKLANSGATLTVPDCVRFRADGSNEVRGIIPDQLIPWRANDGRAFRARLLEAALPEVARRAQALHRAR